MNGSEDRPVAGHEDRVAVEEQGVRSTTSFFTRIPSSSNLLAMRIPLRGGSATNGSGAPSAGSGRARAPEQYAQNAGSSIARANSLPTSCSAFWTASLCRLSPMLSMALMWFDAALWLS